ncbi:hypothetical protein BK796_06935 [Kosakonia pseudosacchari]|uniref:Uncharacterized protein n=1 Tax=Kosakonia pseudosacchari TaxID=1646340 RepID=A0ABX4IVA2_9ENTR|nr:hypothetical protein BK796_06935 [Kosakonia pseudosacchari]
MLKIGAGKCRASISDGGIDAAAGEASLIGSEGSGGAKSAETHNYRVQKHQSGSFKLHIANA